MGVSFGAIASMPFEAMGHGGLATMPHTGRDGRRGVHPRVPVVWVSVIKVCVGGERGRGRKRGRRRHGMVQVARRRCVRCIVSMGLGGLGSTGAWTSNHQSRRLQTNFRFIAPDRALFR